MWSDALLAAERAHLLRLLLWGGSCVLAGTALLTVVALRRIASPLLRHFAIQTLAWGAVDLVLAGYAWRGLRLRDHAGAVWLDRLLWLNVGLDAGYVFAGFTLAIAGWVMGRRLGAVGAGVAIVVQGLALGVMDLVFTAQVVR